MSAWREPEPPQQIRPHPDADSPHPFGSARTAIKADISLKRVESEKMITVRHIPGTTGRTTFLSKLSPSPHERAETPDRDPISITMSDSSLPRSSNRLLPCQPIDFAF